MTSCAAMRHAPLTWPHSGIWAFCASTQVYSPIPSQSFPLPLGKTQQLKFVTSCTSRISAKCTLLEHSNTTFFTGYIFHRRICLSSHDVLSNNLASAFPEG